MSSKLVEHLVRLGQVGWDAATEKDDCVLRRLATLRELAHHLHSLNSKVMAGTSKDANSAEILTLQQRLKTIRDSRQLLYPLEPLLSGLHDAKLTPTFPLVPDRLLQAI